MSFTQTTRHTARKPHMCDWCWTRIEPGEQYVRYRWFDGGDAITCKHHPECFVAMEQCDDLPVDGWTPGDNPRGCNCGFTAGCARCAERAKA